MDNVILDVQSIGFGVQSTAMAIMSGIDEMPRADKYYFSLLRETPQTLDYIDYIIPRLSRLGVDVEILKPIDIYEHVLSWPISDRVSMLPLWFLGNDGRRQPLNRQCTKDFKIDVIAAEIRNYLGIKRLKRNSVRIWQGISIDEISRAKRSALFPDSFRVNHYPYIGQFANITYPGKDWESFSRQKITTNIFNRLGIKVPPRSSCFFCPFHDVFYWLWLYENCPKEWELACVLDESIRNYNNKNSSLEAGPFFLYSGLIPLKEIDFDREIKKQNQVSLFGCETGFCFM